MRLNIKNGDYATAHTHWEKEGVEWVDVGGNNTEFQKYHPGTNYPIRSERFFTVGGYHSPDDLKIPGPSLVVGRTTSTYSLGGGEYNFITPDPFIRFFLFQ